ncbi:flagellar basal body rod protein FlgB [Geomicrobium sp. JCM 19038]|uniref:flagellar basal body rod protein FlgB n=1 Tax=Geomicrobium sp. JCM 19038 TaxID=1460635 RepID=UPI00045F3188|nr:flagellar basal body rod protein FlgB [Geomicrobium sp. JCM 19038]GAK07521.1 flagellar basal-body rod protein FlgB [Geomicrobium sp. JCM 19038]
MALFSTTISSLERGMNASMMQQQAIASNIANVDTPNYKAKQVQFKDVLSEAKGELLAHRTDERHVPFTYHSEQMKQVNPRNVMYSHSGNSVDLDKEMAKMANNQVYYQAVSDRLNGQFSSLKTAIRGGS